MKFAIVESGGKQFRAVEGATIDVDRLPREVGDSFDFERVLLMADGDAVSVGTPTVGGVTVSATVVDHLKGPKVLSFKYRPKKRIRVRGGHRQQYTLLMVDFIGKPGEKRKVEEPKVEKQAEAKVEVVEAQKKPKAEKQAKPSKEAAKPSAKKAPAKKAPAKKEPATKKPSSKKTDSKKK